MDIIFDLNSPPQTLDVNPTSTSQEEVFPYQPMTHPSSVSVSTKPMDITDTPKLEVHFIFPSETDDTL